MTPSIGSLLLLGASGDLSGRLLLPALGQLLDREESRREVVLVGAGSEDWDANAWQQRVRTSFADGKVSEEALQSVLDTTRYQKADVTSADDLQSLIDSCPPAPALYFALPPSVTVAACKALQQVSLPEGTNLVLEKPFGTNQESAASLNQLLAELVPEDQVHRVDHFLGRSTVLNLLGVRFANRLFEPVWSNEHIEHVDIVFDEQLTLENRARYYDSAGALMDMIQSHLLQVLALVAMEPIATVDAVDLRDAKAQVLRACSALGRRPGRSRTPGSLHQRLDRWARGSRLHGRAGGRSGAEHRNAGRADRRDRQLALVRGAVPAAFGQGAARAPQGSAGHLQAAAAPANRAAWEANSGSVAAEYGARPDGAGDEHQRPE